MEIHAPEKPILTVKEAAVHLLIVTAGILIALSLEAVVEYVHHRTVVREAREIMRQEIEANRAELDKYKARLKGLRGLPKALKTVLESIPKTAHPMDVMRTAVSALSAASTALSVIASTFCN